MKNLPYLKILMCIFVARIIAMSGSYVDAICLTALIAYHFGIQYMEIKKVSNEVTELVNKNKVEAMHQMQALADEIQKAKNSADGIKAAINFTSKK